MGLFSNLRKNWDTPPKPDFPVVQIPAVDLHAGMVLAGMPESWVVVRPRKDGAWPVIVEAPEYEERGEGGVPCVYWVTDEPALDRHYWSYSDTLITVSAELEDAR
jgi:hypothetical protein